MKKLLVAVVFITALFAAQNANGQGCSGKTCNKGHSLVVKSVKVQKGTTKCTAGCSNGKIDGVKYTNMQVCKKYNANNECIEYETKPIPSNCSKCDNCKPCLGTGTVPVYGYENRCYCSSCDEYYSYD
ncbi:MAG: hypothetical protein LBT27_07475 [Prevotellaceae bacterium]|nr:hypothetical protein [Prevotellaceae bacterium]